MGEIGIHGETGETRPNVRVVHRVLVDIVPSVGDVKRLDRVDAAIVARRVEGPGLAGARSMDPVDGAGLNGLEGGVLGAVDGGVYFLFPPRLVGLFCWCKNALGDRLTQDSWGVSSVILCGCSTRGGLQHTETQVTHVEG